MKSCDKVPICRPMALLPHLQLHAADLSIHHNPMNTPFVGMSALSMTPLPPERIAVFTGKRWKPGTQLTVGFMEQVDASLRQMILSYMGRWSQKVNIDFVYSQQNPIIRITLTGNGYYSYIGTDALSIPADQPTFCLQNWSLSMPESECLRVIQHEAGHALGSPHEHARPAIVALLDPGKTTSYFEATQGWSAQMIQQQILTPLHESDLIGITPELDSIMTYQFPGECTISGEPIPGGTDITADDMAFMASIYPGRGGPSTPTPTPTPSPMPPPPPPPPPTGELVAAIGGPFVVANVGPGAPMVIALPLDGPTRFRIQVIVAGRQDILRIIRIRPSVAITGPSGHVTDVPLAGDTAIVATANRGTYHVQVSYPIVRQLGVIFSPV